MQTEPIHGYWLSPQQRRVWELQRSSLEFITQCTLLLEGAVDSVRLQRAVASVVKRHEILRSNFEKPPALDLPLQIIADHNRFSFVEIDLRDAEREGQRREVEAIARQARRRAPSFESDPLLSLCLVALSEREHVLVITLPALCGDIRTLKNLVAETCIAYERETLDWEPVPLQYADYSEWQDVLLEQGDVAGDEFWRRQFAFLAPFSLPLEARQHSSFDSEYAVVDLSIHSRVAEELKALAGSLGVSTDDFLLACWHVLLWRLTGVSDIVTGKVAHGRSNDELSRSMGLFTKVLPIVGRFNSERSFEGLLNEIRECASAAEDWQEYFTWERVTDLEASDPQQRYFPVHFEYDCWSSDDQAHPFEVSLLGKYECVDEYELKLSFVETDGRLGASFYFFPDQYTREYIEHVAATYYTLLKSAISEVRATVGSLELLDAGDLRRLAVEINQTQHEMEPDGCVHRLFEERAGRVPDAVVAVFEDEQITYDELNSRANRIAHFLHRYGVGPRVLGGVFIERSLDMLAAVIGILKAGGAYVPIDTELPYDRLEQLFHETEHTVLITQKRLLPKLPAADGVVICLDRDWSLFERESSDNLGLQVAPENLAYVIFTSGSTGRPKGVAVTHKNLFNYTSSICSMLDVSGSREPLTFATVSTLAADLGNTAIFPSLVSGGTLHVLSYVVATDASEFASYVSRNAIDVLKIVPSHLSALLAGARDAEALPRRYLIAGGEALSFTLIDRIHDLGARCSVLNHYGPTETTVGAVASFVESVEDLRPICGTVPIGRPLTNTQVYILDPEGRVVPLGVPGELYIGGAGLARGYLNQPDQTAARFVPDSMGTCAGARLYRTGDLARYLLDGSIEFLGRTDYQVKIHGYRIELGEIECCLREHASVREAVVLARRDDADSTSLVAYIVPDRALMRNPEQQLYRLPNNLLVAHHNRHETDFFYHQIFVEQENCRHGIQIGDDACVFDVGANIGLFTLFVHLTCRNPTIFAFEPIPATFELLRRNIHLHDVQAKLLECGLSSESGTVEMTFYPLESCMSGYYADKDQDREMLKSIMSANVPGMSRTAELEDLDRLVDERIESQVFTCRLRTLSEIIDEHDVREIDLLKIDVEKSEYDVLAGIRQEHWQRIRQIVIEAHDIEGRISRIGGLLEKNGYTVAVEQGAGLRQTGLYNIYAVRPFVSEACRREQPGIDYPADRVPREDDLLAAELRAFAQKRLPAYMVPSAFILLEGLPLTRNGKIDRESLPSFDRPGSEARAAYAPPRSQTEEILASIWSQVLRVERVGIDDNFLSLGGDSIRSIQVRYRAEESGVSFSTRELGDNPTIRQLAAVARPARAKEESQLAPFCFVDAQTQCEFGPEIEDAYPLTMLQAGMIFHSEFSEGASAYHDIIGYRLRCRYDIERLQTAAQQLSSCHPALRTSIHLTGFAEPLQIVHRFVRLAVEAEDLRSRPATEQTRALVEWFETEKLRKFDLTTAPLVRITVHRIQNEEFWLSISHHHSLIDGWSNALMVTELIQRYLFLLDDEEYPERALSATFRDYVALEREALSSSDNAEFWTTELRDCVISKLPRWGVEPDSRGGLRVSKVCLPADLSRQLTGLAQSIGSSLKSVLLTAHLKVMQALSGEADVLTGLVSHGRPDREGGDRVLGLFLNSLPFRHRVSGGTWIDIVNEVQLAVHRLEPYRRFPLIEAQRLSGGESLFETLFNFSNFHVFRDLSGSENFECVDVKSFQETNFTLLSNFYMSVQTPEINLNLEYDARELGDEQIETIGGYYLNTLKALASTPLSRHDDYSPMTEPEKHRLLVEWNETQQPYTEGVCIQDLFTAVVKLMPDAIALVHEGCLLTYGEVHRRANQLAHYLQQQGVGADSLVGICIERSPEMITGMLGVIQAGAAYLPLDPGYPPQRLAYMVTDSNLRIVVTKQQFRHLFESLRVQLICLDEDLSAIAKNSVEEPARRATPDSLVVTLYTSGSTGTPKAVMRSHRSLINLILWQRQASKKSPRRTLQFASLSFDVSFQEIFSTLADGGALVLISEQHRQDPLQLMLLISEQSVERLFVPFVALQQLAEAAADRTWPCSLREVITAGEQLKVTRQIERLFGSLEVCYLENQYGPTESHVVTAYRLEGSAHSWPELPPIGRPISNTRIRILDRGMLPAPIGVQGELYIGGDGLARCYLGRADQTAERFVPDPFEIEPGARLYRTGDLARYMPDGNIVFLGRRDDQVKIRGYRVEIAEIEVALAEHAAVAEAVVVLREDKQGDKRLIAYVVAQLNRPEPSSRELRAYLFSRLPDYMVPAEFVFLQALPQSPNGKVNRRTLPVPDFGRILPEESYAPPSTAAEEVLCGIWGDVLGVERVGVHDNFFDIGGHSLKATQIVSRVREAFRIDLPVRTLFEAPTIASLARSIAEGRHGKQPVAPPLRVRSVSGNDELPLSFAQQRLWFLSQLKRGNPFYNTSSATRLDGGLNEAALTASLGEIVRRHDVLRTAFTANDGVPVQVIAQPRPLSLPLIDLEGIEESERQPIADEIARGEARRPFDLAAGPVLRPTLMRMTQREHILLLVTHHIVSDDWSMGVFAREATALYRAFSEGLPSPLAELPLQYGDFAVWQREALQGEILDRQLSYWRSSLSGAPPMLSLPADRPRPRVQSFIGATEQIVLPAELSKKARDFSRREGVTLFMTLLAAFKTLLYSYSFQTDLIVGTPIANREHVDLEKLIGFFSNLLVLRTNLSGNPTFRKLVRQVRELTLEAYAHQDLPFERIVEELHLERNLEYTPLVQVVFSLQNAPAHAIELPDLLISGVEIESGTAMFDIALSLLDTEPELRGGLLYNSDLFDRATIAGILSQFITILQRVLANPEMRLFEILQGILSDSEIDAPPMIGSSSVQNRCRVEQFNF